MKKLSGVFICLLLFTVLSSARIIEVADAGITDKLRAVIAAKNAPAGESYPGFDYDVYEDFEDALAGSWSETDVSTVLDPNNSDAEYVGTYGMKYDSATTAEAYANYTLGAGSANLSVGFWFKSGTYAGWAGDSWILVIYNDTNGSALVVREGNSAGDDSRRLSWGTDADVITIADATWYYLTCEYVQNGTSQCNLYNTSLAKVGSTMSGASNDWIAEDVRICGYSVASSTACFYDEVFIDTTDATFPLGPPVGTP